MAGNLRSRARAKALMQRSLKIDTSESPLSPTPDRCNSAEEAARCAICLGEVADLSYSNMCLHKFCYGCLVEWSKIKPECPLCKTTFTSIYHNIRSNDDYDEYHVPPVEPAPQYPSITEIYQRIHQIHDDLLNARRTHRIHPYGPTAISQSGMFQPFRRSQVRIVEYLPLHRGGNESNPFRDVLGSDSYRIDSNHGTSILQGSGIRNYQNRRRVYDRDQWVQPLNSTGTSRGGPSSVHYVQTHVGSTARAKSFLYRELTVLMGLRSTLYELAALYDTIMNVLEVYDVRSREFHDLVTGYLGDRTRHFQHELYYFLLSGLALDEYDCRSSYTVSGQPSGDVERRSAPVVVDLEDTDDEQTIVTVHEIDCEILPEETASTSHRTRATASASGSMNLHSVSTDGPWDLTVGGETVPQIIPIRNEGASSSSVRISDLADRRPVLPNDYSTWEERRNQDRLHAIYQDVYSSTSVLETMIDNPYDIDHAYSSVRLQDYYASARPSRSRIPTATVTSSAAASESSRGIVIENVTSLSASPDSELQSQQDDDDCVLVGVQPVVKKPPLAVITISDSEDESENAQTSLSGIIVPRYKNEVPEAREDSGTDDFLESFTNRVSSASQLSRGDVGMETTVVESIPLLTWESWNEFSGTTEDNDTAMPGPSSAIRIVEYSQEVDVGNRRESSRSRSHRSHKKSSKAKRKRRYSSSDNESQSSKRRSLRKSSRDSYTRSKYSSETTADQASESETESRFSSPNGYAKSKKRSKQKHKKSKHRSEKSSKKKSRNKSPPPSDSSDSESPRDSSSGTARTKKSASRDSERGRRY